MSLIAKKRITCVAASAHWTREEVHRPTQNRPFLVFFWGGRCL